MDDLHKRSQELQAHSERIYKEAQEEMVKVQKKAKKLMEELSKILSSTPHKVPQRSL